MNAAEQLRAAAAKRILVKDGAFGTRSRATGCDEADYRRQRSTSSHDQKGNNDLLNLTRPDVVARDLAAPISTPAPTSSRPTPSTPTRSARPTTAPSIWSREINLAAARIARACADARAGRTAAALRRRRARPDQQDPVAVARRQRSRLSRGRLRRDQGRLSRADRRAARRRRRLHPDRDGVRHAERQGRDRRADEAADARARSAGDGVDDADRPRRAATSRARRSRPSGTRCATPSR